MQIGSYGDAVIRIITFVKDDIGAGGDEGYNEDSEGFKKIKK